MDADLFSEGSIYYYENKSHTKKDYNDPSLNQDFIVSRPLYVLNNRQTPFDQFTVNVLIITTSNNRVGIPINIDGFKDGKVLPYAIHSVHKENLVKYMGRASDDIISEVSKAVKYHQGYSDEKPVYLIDYENKLLTEKNMINKMSVKEKTVYMFLKERCIFNPSYVVTYDELFRMYSKTENENGYSRSQDFARVLNKHIKEMDDVSVEIMNKVKIFHGFSINGNVHKIEVKGEGEDSHKRRVVSQSYKPYELVNNNDDLYNLLSKKGQHEYSKLDIIQKVDYYTTSLKYFNINGLSCEDDKYIIKKMIANDVHQRKDKILNKLKSGRSPLDMSTTDQYVLYICSNTEIRSHVKPYYIKSGGVNQLKKEIRKNIKHYFKKIK